MLTSFFLALVGSLGLSGAHADLQVASDQPLDTAFVRQWREDLTYIARELPRRHKNLFHAWRREQFDSAMAALDRKLPTLARHQVIVELARIVAHVGDGHTNIAPTRDPRIGFHTYPVSSTSSRTDSSSGVPPRRRRIWSARKWCGSDG